MNEEVKPEDKIRRIVLYQTTTIADNTVKTDLIQLKDNSVLENQTTQKNIEAKAPNISILEPK